MNYPKIEVDGGGYTTACDWLYDGNHAIYDALNTLADALAASSGMAGGDQSGVQWAGEYDKAAGKLVDAASQLCDAFAKAANLTNTSLSNHDAADGGSIYGGYPGEPAMPPEDKDPDHYGEGIYFTVPSAKGDTGGEPGWWHWLASHLEGWFWPNADTGKLRTIGAAWRTAGQSIQWSDIYATTAATELGIEKSPEITVATKALNDLGKHCDTIGGAFIDIGNACDGYAKMVDDKHTEIENELQSFLEWTAGIEIAGGIVSIFTAGIAEAPTQAVEGAEVANAASKVVRLLGALLDAVKGSEVVANVITRIEKVVPVLGRFLKAEKDVVEVEKAAAEAERAALIDELTANGVKFSEDKIVTIFRDSEGRVVFLEEGGPKAGLQHVLDHEAEFATRGISRGQIPDMLKTALTDGKVVGYQGKGTGRPIYEFVFNGVKQRVAITVGDNGYIVGANPAR